ncbi:deoxyribonuclease V [Endozoicomonas ascidiicola]|uniref:deoxyribonuclease V n=1 Tax=Endozoicomonas ascidiicola TaxID=1698521 RepID=UPI00082ADF15|nr:deoxyribonuclease V [Endozoicomonas ascidiicola]
MSEPHSWDVSPAELRALQTTLARQVIQSDDLPTVNKVAGVDVGFEDSGRITRAAVAVLSFPELELLDYSIARVPTCIPYVPGLLSFRECPAILAALEQLRSSPDLLLCDGQGIAHPRRLGVACHLGVLTGLPTIGVAKSRLCGNSQPLAEEKGAREILWDRTKGKEDIIGTVLRTRTGVRPLYISVGHRISLTTAVHYVESCLTRYRLPETIRWADALASNRGQALHKANQRLGR